MITLSKINLWRPTNPKVEINPNTASCAIPQAWENNWNWYYNWQWAMYEAKFLGQRLPTIDELIESLKDEETKN